MSVLLKLNFVLVLILCLVELWAAQTTDYCSPELCNYVQHIACNNTGAFATACAANAKVIPIGHELRMAILNKHNELRNLVAEGKLKGFEPALRMATMTWNPELAELAVLNVKQCSMQHDQCHSTLTYKNSGQNLASTGWSGISRNVQDIAMEHIKMWFDENKAANMQVINNLEAGEEFGNYGHFTELIQEKNCRVGCGILRQTTDDFDYQYMACNYAYTNVVDTPVYRKGTTASECSNGTNENFPGLCNEREEYNVNSMSYEVESPSNK